MHSDGQCLPDRERYGKSGKEACMMKVSKKVIGKLEKCYSVAPLHYAGEDHVLVAAEKVNRCLLFDRDGNEEDVVWSEPGGVMTMVQVPGSDGQFLATHKFYSPNDSKEAQIVIVTPKAKGNWEVRTLVNLPHVHRFDILRRNGVSYLIACTLKSGHEYKDDWSMPGKVYAAVLPEDMSDVDEANPLKLKVIRDNMLKNHGYYRNLENGTEEAVISCDSGVFLFTPPENPKDEWEIRQLLDTAASDAVLVDLDGDGEEELAVLSPFHGPVIRFYKRGEHGFQCVYEYEKQAEFTHAIFGGTLCGRPAVVIGHRQGARNLLAFTWNAVEKRYEVQILDEDCGPANVMHYTHNGNDVIISTNREIDEIAMYTLSQE